jgi:16S rRNA pseudouridine516 synthase
MLAATGHKVIQLHRSRMSNLVLSDDLRPGQWRWLTTEELADLTRKQ